MFTFNLISVTKLTSSIHCYLKFTDKFCDIQDLSTSRTIGSAEEKHGLYVLRNLGAPFPSIFSFSTTIVPNANSWHFRLGHTSKDKIFVLHKQFPFISINDCDDLCNICPLAKQKKLPFPVSSSRSTKAFDLLHMDIWGPVPTVSMHGHRYFLTVVDDYNRHTWLFLLKQKCKVESCIKSFLTFIENQFSCTVKAIRFGNGVEFNMQSYYQFKGIIHQTSYVATPQ